MDLEAGLKLMLYRGFQPKSAMATLRDFSTSQLSHVFMLMNAFSNLASNVYKSSQLSSYAIKCVSSPQNPIFYINEETFALSHLSYLLAMTNRC